MTCREAYHLVMMQQGIRPGPLISNTLHASLPLHTINVVSCKYTLYSPVVTNLIYVCRLCEYQVNLNTITMASGNDTPWLSGELHHRLEFYVILMMITALVSQSRHALDSGLLK